MLSVSGHRNTSPRSEEVASEFGSSPADLTWHSFNLSPAMLKSHPEFQADEAIAVINPFSTVTRIRSVQMRTAPKIVIAMPMSGHMAALIYDLVAGLVIYHDIDVVDWIDASQVPQDEGRFGFDDTIATIIDAVHASRPGAHLVGLCQSAVPAIVAATAMIECSDPSRPLSLTLIGGPVDPRAQPTRVSTSLAMTPLCWFEHNILERVPRQHPGYDRLVYPAEVHHRSLLMYLTRHLACGGAVAKKVLYDDGSDPAQFPFEALCLNVKSIAAEAFLESISAIYQRHALWTNAFRFRHRLLDPAAITDLPLLTIEAPQDDIAAPGQTTAAHRLFMGVPDHLHAHYLLNSGSHFDLIHGSACRNEVVPAIENFIADVE